MQYLAAAYTLRKPYAGYMGPLLNACQGQGPNSPCEDIGLSGNDIDTTTLSAFCGPVSGLNNCTVQKWYNSALNQNVTVAGGNSALDFTAVSTSARPTIAFSGCGTSKITVCIVTSPTHYFTGGGRDQPVHRHQWLHALGGGPAYRLVYHAKRHHYLGHRHGS